MSSCARHHHRSSPTQPSCSQVLTLPTTKEEHSLAIVQRNSLHTTTQWNQRDNYKKESYIYATYLWMDDGDFDGCFFFDKKSCSRPKDSEAISGGQPIKLGVLRICQPALPNYHLTYLRGSKLLRVFPDESFFNLNSFCFN